MSEWAMKRFWTNVTVEGAKDGHRVLLDGRRVKTPAKTDLVLPTEGLAQAVAGDLLSEGIYVIGFSYPVVSKGEARIRVQLSAAHTTEHIERAVEAFTKVGRKHGVL